MEEGPHNSRRKFLKGLAAVASTAAFGALGVDRKAGATENLERLRKTREQLEEENRIIELETTILKGFSGDDINRIVNGADVRQVVSHSSERQFLKAGAEGVAALFVPPFVGGAVGAVVGGTLDEFQKSKPTKDQGTKKSRLEIGTKLGILAGTVAGAALGGLELQRARKYLESASRRVEEWLEETRTNGLLTSEESTRQVISGKIRILGQEHEKNKTKLTDAG